MKILNLYAGIGGNRKFWGNEHEVTAVEINPKIAQIYKEFFPQDKIIIGDAHQYLLEHYREFDFIWSSPPCQSHSRVRFMGTRARHPKTGIVIRPIYPDLKLYEEIIFLSSYFKGKWIVENVRGYYDPLIKPVEFGRHYFWCNFPLGKISTEGRKHNSSIKEIQKRKGFDLDGKDVGYRKDVVLRNCVEPEIGLHILNMATKKPQLTLI